MPRHAGALHIALQLVLVSIYVRTVPTHDTAAEAVGGGPGGQGQLRDATGRSRRS